MGQTSQQGQERERDTGRGEERQGEGVIEGRVKLASLPSGAAASQWRLTGKESNAPNRTHRGPRCVCVCVCVCVRKRKENDSHR